MTLAELLAEQNRVLVAIDAAEPVYVGPVMWVPAPGAAGAAGAGKYIPRTCGGYPGWMIPKDIPETAPAPRWGAWGPGSAPAVAPAPAVRCECGSEKAGCGAGAHSDWCPKAGRP